MTAPAESPENQDPPTAPRSDRPMDGEMVVFLWGITLLLISLIALPWLLPLIEESGKPPRIESLGKVTRVHFVGGFGTATQVETLTKTLLLGGAVELAVGTEIERRTTRLTDELCAVGTQHCHEIASRRDD